MPNPIPLKPGAQNARTVAKVKRPKAHVTAAAKGRTAAAKARTAVAVAAERKSYRIPEVISMLGMSRSSFYRRLADKTIPSIHVGGVTLIPASAVRALLGE
jgi:predicted DNA-binding transcriptional regulator AlpA